MTYIALYVDDLLIISEDDNDLAEVKRWLTERFEMKDMGVARKFLGMEIEYGDDGSIKIHQEQYIQGLFKCYNIIPECDLRWRDFTNRFAEIGTKRKCKTRFRTYECMHWRPL